MILRSGKKGEGSPISAFVAITISVVVLLIIVGTLLPLIMEGGTRFASDAACRNSVILRWQAQERAPVFDAIGLANTPLLCKTDDLGVLRGDRENIKSNIAQMATACWWMYGEGRPSDIFRVERDGVGCGVCFYFRIPNNMDQGEMLPEERRFFNESIEERLPNIISGPEMYNYLIATEKFLAPVYGPEEEMYIGDRVRFMHDFPADDEHPVINIRRISAAPIDSFVRDYSGFLTQETIRRIDEVGLDLTYNLRGNLLVLVADEFDYIDRRAARRLVEELNLNSPNRYDAILLMIGIQNKEVRLHMGGELELYMSEYEIKEILEQGGFEELRPILDRDAFNQAVVRTINLLNSKLTEGTENLLADLGVSANSYYGYLSNKGRTFPVIEELEAGPTYAVVYMSHSTLLNRWDSVKREIGDVSLVGVSGAGVVTRAAGGRVILNLIMKGSTFIPVVGPALRVTGLVAMIYPAVKDPGGFLNGLTALTRGVRADEKTLNYIVVANIHDVGSICNT